MIANIFKTAIYHHSKKNFLKAKEIYETLLKTNPNNFDILQNYAVLLSQIKEYKKADIVFKKCLEDRPKDSLLLYNYGKFFHDQKIFDKAIKFYKESFE
ncbi:MAG: tetratricopeptide repeat protein, partial [Pelagibacteraceae bacterium]|nr:tetratricopeptide repeat protein [Pelagibacteraceae bacterium]